MLSWIPLMHVCMYLVNDNSVLSETGLQVNKAPLTSPRLKGPFLSLFIILVNSQQISMPFFSVVPPPLFSIFLSQTQTQFQVWAMLRYQMLDSAPSFLDSLKTLETDIQHANVLWVLFFSLSCFVAMLIA